jgi:hypothetical protein
VNGDPVGDPYLEPGIWAWHWFTAHSPIVAQFAMLPLVRDVCHVNSMVLFEHIARAKQIVLNRIDLLAQKLCSGLAALLVREQVANGLGRNFNSWTNHFLIGLRIESRLGHDSCIAPVGSKGVSKCVSKHYSHSVGPL